VGHTVARLPDLQQIRVKAWLSDVDDGRVEADMPAEVYLDAYPDRVLKGKVLEIASWPGRPPSALCAGCSR
jgi:multidrug resistance efflux pump